MKTIKTLMRINKYLQKKNKCIQYLLKSIYNAMKKFRLKWQSVVYLLTIFAMLSCGSTKVSVDRPSAGTSTTITVTTNNPITTEVNANAELKK